MKDNTSVLYLYDNGDSGFTSSTSIEHAVDMIISRCKSRKVSMMYCISFIDGKSVSMECSSPMTDRVDLLRRIKWQRYYWLGWDGTKFMSDADLQILHTKTSAEKQTIYDSL